MSDTSGAPRTVRLPLRERFRGVTSREAVLFEGPAGWGEFGPFWDYPPADCVPWLRSASESAFLGWPAPVRDRVAVNVTVPAVGPARAAQLVRASGCTTAKVKVADRPGEATVEEDLARLEAVRDALGPDGAVRIDANGAWDVDTATRLLPRYDKAAGGLQYAEQPCPDVEDLATLRRRTSVLIAADESIRRAEDPLRVARLHAADMAVLKVAPLGGVRACLEIAERIGLPVVVSSAVETSVGLAAGLALAAALQELPYACGLGTALLLAADVTDTPLLPVDGVVPVRRVAPSADLLTQLSADEETRARWERRLADVRALAGSR